MRLQSAHAAAGPAETHRARVRPRGLQGKTQRVRQGSASESDRKGAHAAKLRGTRGPRKVRRLQGSRDRLSEAAKAREPTRQVRAAVAQLLRAERRGARGAPVLTWCAAETEGAAPPVVPSATAPSTGGGSIAGATSAGADASRRCVEGPRIGVAFMRMCLKPRLLRARKPRAARRYVALASSATLSPSPATRSGGLGVWLRAGGARPAPAPSLSRSPARAMTASCTLDRH